MANNYSSLKNNYMYGSKNRLNNYYQNYKNLTNSLEDPIFTGFTFYLNIEQSPLFSGSSLYYLNDGSAIDGSSLASKIQASIKSKHGSQSNTYEQTITSIEKFDSDKKIGYGNQSSVFSEGFSYNALEYIYMVDKVLGNTPSKKATSKENVSKFKSPEKGTKTEAQQVKTDESKTKDPSELQKMLDELKKKYNDASLKYTSLAATIGAANMLLEEAKEAYENALKELESLRKIITELKEEYTMSMYFFNLIMGSMALLKEYIGTKLGVVSNNTISVQSTNCDTHMNTYYPMYKDADTYGYKYGIDHDYIPESAYESIKNDMCAEYPGYDIDINWLKEDIAKPIIEPAYCTYDAGLKMETVEDDIYSKNRDVNGKLIELYGQDDAGDPLSESDATPDSLYGKYKSALDESNGLKNSDDSGELGKLADEIKKLTDELDKAKAYDENGNPIENATDDSSTASQAEPISVAENNDTYDDSTTATFAPQSCIDLISFINGMRVLTETTPYIFQTATGLDEAYKTYFKNSEPYQGSGENKITINCYESVDMRVSSLFNKYFNAAYDREYKRDRLPMNLRKFNCSIFVHDIRNFRHALNILHDKGLFKEDGDNTNQSLITEVALNHLSAVEFKFFECEIIPEETGNIFDTLNNADLGEQRMTNFSFKYGNCFINFLPFKDLVNFYKTSGSNNDLGDESNIVKATRVLLEDGKITKTEPTEQVSNFTEEEEKINKSKTEETGFILDSWENVNDDDEQKLFEAMTKNANFDMSRNSLHQAQYNHYTNGDDDYKSRYYLGDINYDDYDEYINRLHNGSAFIRNEINTGGNDHLGGGMLGNVNYDDYYEYLNRTYNEDYLTAKFDYFKRAYAEDTAMHSIDDLYDESRRALDITMRSLSASTGYPTDDLYKEFGLGNVYDAMNEADVVTEIGDAFGDVEDNGIAKDLGDVIEDVDDIGTTKYIGDVIPEPKSDGDTTNLGDIIGDTTDDGIATDLGDIIGDVEDNGITEEIGDVIDDTSYSGIAGNLGDVIDDVEDDGVTKDLGDVIDDIEPLDEVDEIGDVITEPKDKGIVSEIGKLKYNTSNDGTYKINENVYPKKKDKDKEVDEIGDAYTKLKEPLYKYDNLGELNMNGDEGDNVDSIGSNAEKITDAGKYKSTNIGEVTEFGSEVKSLGAIIMKPSDGIMVDSIGNVYKGVSSDGVYKSEKRNENITESVDVKRIGNVITNEDYTIDELNKLNDVDFK